VFRLRKKRAPPEGAKETRRHLVRAKKKKKPPRQVTRGGAITWGLRRKKDKKILEKSQRIAAGQDKRKGMSLGSFPHKKKKEAAPPALKGRG